MRATIGRTYAAPVPYSHGFSAISFAFLPWRSATRRPRRHGAQMRGTSVSSRRYQRSSGWGVNSPLQFWHRRFTGTACRARMGASVGVGPGRRAARPVSSASTTQRGDRHRTLACSRSGSCRASVLCLGRGGGADGRAGEVCEGLTVANAVACGDRLLPGAGGEGPATS